MWRFSNRSNGNLVGVHPKLEDVTRTALEYSPVDFGVTEGVRTLERQKQYVEQKVSWTMDSFHLAKNRFPQYDENHWGHAVDVAAYIGPRVSWEMPLYCKIASAFRDAARVHGVGLIWGGAWHCPDIRGWDGSMEELHENYIFLRQSEGRRVTIDGPHFQVCVID